ncbi:hypothetical protein MRB53_016087 [Persea americana]|uniref:Uncharacterized protein n=1 Tax=Persea americana TaxID=3435 RepID=A0ACC2M1T0_PERAE|nr:hypothetical protein MRB53_016087 [Persea americana]|eukprot:TRINITY_DN2649_c0_g1_i1.p1 TRINITY_DN2649_c0_g1~~TRINITY_DN2649_c0_g1_i1.p1  ORF type:complete len:260 (-),score=52.30 TRINITY_DN2649_c0_g1_i1:884-1663(-)
MDSLQIRFSELCLVERARNLKSLHKSSLLHPFSKTNSSSSSSSPHFLKISCGLRGGPRKPLWRGRVLSTEAIQAVQSLKLAKSASKLEDVFDSKISRLLKADLIATLEELQRQNEWEIALKVFDFVRKEEWYRPDLSLYCGMIFVMGNNKLTGIAEALFSKLQKEGLEPDTRAYTEMIGAFLQVGMVEKAMETYRLMKESGCEPDKLTLTILIRNLEKAGEEELASSVMKDSAKYVDFPNRFTKEVKKKHPKMRSFEIV